MNHWSEDLCVRSLLSYADFSSPQKLSDISAEQTQLLRWHSASQAHWASPPPNPVLKIWKSSTWLFLSGLMPHVTSFLSHIAVLLSTSSGTSHRCLQFLSGFYSHLCFSMNLSHFCHWSFLHGSRNMLPLCTVMVIFSCQFGNRLSTFQILN